MTLSLIYSFTDIFILASSEQDEDEDKDIERNLVI